MNRIDQCLREVRKDSRKGLIAYITAGDPSMDQTREYVFALEAAGVDMVELGIPFSDPLADGPVNQASAERALKAGATFDRLLSTIRAIRTASQIPMVLYSYLNPLLAHGFDRAVELLSQAGADGLLTLDLTPEEAIGHGYYHVLAKHGLHPICLVTPTSTDDRIRKIVRHARGFVYCISRAGVTGARAEMSHDAALVVRRTRAHTSLPIALGFGISSPATAKAAAREADAVVVGSALVQRLHEASQSANPPAALALEMNWVRSLSEAIRRP